MGLVWELTRRARRRSGSMVSVGWDLNDQARRHVAWCRKGLCSVNDRHFDNRRFLAEPRSWIGDHTRRGPRIAAVQSKRGRNRRRQVLRKTWA